MHSGILISARQTAAFSTSTTWVRRCFPRPSMPIVPPRAGFHRVPPRSRELRALAEDAVRSARMGLHRSANCWKRSVRRNRACRSSTSPARKAKARRGHDCRGLSAAGYRTGLFTSPHLERIEQRMAIDGRPCEAEEFVELVDRLRPAVKALDRRAPQGKRAPRSSKS